MESLLEQIRACNICQSHLPHGPRPVVQASKSSSLLIIGQAPGARVHASGIAWDDPSGNKLREWLGIDRPVFYDAAHIALMPMGFCYPGTGKSGDLPPRPECAPAWHPQMLEQLKNIKLTLLIGQYAQLRYLNLEKGQNLTDTVKNWRSHLPAYLPLPHPSPRNQFWLKNNPWFASEVLPVLRERVADCLNMK